jgi:hypothetical protein
MSVIRFAKPGSKSASACLPQLLERKPRKLAAVALANKMVWIIWDSRQNPTSTGRAHDRIRTNIGFRLDNLKPSGRPHVVLMICL